MTIGGDKRMKLARVTNIDGEVTILPLDAVHHEFEDGFNDNSVFAGIVS